MKQSTLLLLTALLALGLMVTARAAPAAPRQTHLPLVLKPEPTPTPLPTPTPPPSVPTEWQGRVNYYRALAQLPPVNENGAWSYGGMLHSRYMVKNDVITHEEDPGNPWYTPEGDAAGRQGNVMVSSSPAMPDSAAIDMWITGPFHALGILDPRLLTSAYGSYREADGGWQMGATLDVLRGRGDLPPGVAFPLKWPQGTTRLPLAYTGGEWPNPLTSCAGYSAPSGPPIMLQLGTGGTTPSVTGTTLLRDGQPVEHCPFDETSYSNPDGGTQATGRSILDMRDAIVIMPRQPLASGSSYTVSVTTNGQTISWSFTVASAATPAALPDGATAEMR